MDNMKIGEIMVANGIISTDQLNEALDEQTKKGGMLGIILVNLNFITPEKLGEILSLKDKTT